MGDDINDDKKKLKRLKVKKDLLEMHECILTRIEEVHTAMGIDNTDEDVRIVNKANIYNTRHLFI